MVHYTCVWCYRCEWPSWCGRVVYEASCAGWEFLLCTHFFASGLHKKKKKNPILNWISALEAMYKLFKVSVIAVTSSHLADTSVQRDALDASSQFLVTRTFATDVWRTPTYYHDLHLQWTLYECQSSNPVVFCFTGFKKEARSVLLGESRYQSGLLLWWEPK